MGDTNKKKPAQTYLSTLQHLKNAAKVQAELSSCQNALNLEAEQLFVEPDFFSAFHTNFPSPLSPEAHANSLFNDDEPEQKLRSLQDLAQTR